MFKRAIDKIKELGVKGVLLMHLGFICCAISTVIFLSPANIVAGGATGLSIFLNLVFTKIPFYVFLYAINIGLLIISFFTLGKDFTIKSIYGSIMLPTFGWIIAKICEWTNFDVNTVVSQVDAGFVVIFAALLMGFGIGTNMRLGGSTGGFDIVEALFLKYLHLPYSISVVIIDIVLVVLGMWKFEPTYNDVGVVTSLFANRFAEGLAATAYIVLNGFMIDVVAFGGFNKRAVFIRSDKYEEIKDVIINKLIRGLTFLDAEGGFTESPTKMIICICYSREYFILRDLVNQIDPNVFMFVTKATEVRGLGFSVETPSSISIRRKKRLENKKIEQEQKKNALK